MTFLLKLQDQECLKDCWEWTRCPRSIQRPNAGQSYCHNKLWARSYCGWKNFTTTLTLKLRVETLRKILTFTYTMNLGVVSQWINNSGALGLARAPWVRKVGYLCIREILVVTWSYVRSPPRPSAQQVFQWKITQSTDMETQMELEVFGEKSRGHPD